MLREIYKELILLSNEVCEKIVLVPAFCMTHLDCNLLLHPQLLIKQNMHVWVDLIRVSRELWHLISIKAFLIKMRPTNIKIRTNIFRSAYYNGRFHNKFLTSLLSKMNTWNYTLKSVLSGQKTTLWGEKVLSSFTPKWNSKKVNGTLHFFKISTSLI